MSLKYYFLLIPIFLPILSCSKVNPTEQPIKGISSHTSGRKLQNPYSVSNMRKAYQALNSPTKSNFQGADEDNIIFTTHYYVKFSPRNEDDLSELKSDSTLVLFQAPLDYEILPPDDYAASEAQTPSPLYASVPASKDLSGINSPFEILEELFIPDDGDFPATKGQYTYSDDFIDALVYKSLELTDNLEDPTPGTKANTEWHPQGRVTYYDDVLSATLPIEGLQVRCKRWFTTHKAYTDKNGYFYCEKTFKNPANYSIVFERYDFEIRSKGTSTAEYDGPKTSGAWVVDFSKNNLLTYYSTIFRAAYKFYYQNIHGLSRPPENGFWRTQLKIKASTDTKNEYGSTNPARRFLGIGSMVKIFTYAEGTLQTYATTIHELAHAAHWNLVIKDDDSNRNKNYNNAEDSMCESWATGLQWYLTKDVYASYLGKYPFGEYTNVVMDLIDMEGEINNGLQFDGVDNLDIVEIQNALKGATSWTEWRNNITKKYPSQKNSIYALFTYWKTTGGF